MLSHCAKHKSCCFGILSTWNFNKMEHTLRLNPNQSHHICCTHPLENFLLDAAHLFIKRSLDFVQLYRHQNTVAVQQLVVLLLLSSICPHLKTEPHNNQLEWAIVWLLYIRLWFIIFIASRSLLIDYSSVIHNCTNELLSAKYSLGDQQAGSYQRLGSVQSYLWRSHRMIRFAHRQQRCLASK